MRPIAIVVARSRVLVEVAIDFARRAGLPRNASEETVFGVVARAETVGKRESSCQAQQIWPGITGE